MLCTCRQVPDLRECSGSQKRGCLVERGVPAFHGEMSVPLT
jgi:hypothetical protein